MRLIDVLTDEERALERRIAELRAEVEALENRKERMGEDLAMLKSNIEYAEQKKRADRQQTSRSWHGSPKYGPPVNDMWKFTELKKVVLED